MKKIELVYNIGLILLTTLYLAFIPLMIFGVLLGFSWSEANWAGKVVGITVFASPVIVIGSIWGAWAAQRRKRFGLAIGLGLMPLAVYVILLWLGSVAG